ARLMAHADSDLRSGMRKRSCPLNATAMHAFHREACVLHREVTIVGPDRIGRTRHPCTQLGRALLVRDRKRAVVELQFDAPLRTEPGWIRRGARAWCVQA